MIELFNLKSKPKLLDLINNEYVDIHSHILPGIDDGPESINDSINLISKIKDVGFKKIIATPHTYNQVYNNTNETIKESYDLLMNSFSLDMKISYASEYMLDHTILEKIKNRSILCLKNNYVLVEMSFMAAPNNLSEIIFEIITNGYIPILAHPERYRFLHGNLQNFINLKKIGCEFQLNLLSVTGYYGAQITKISEYLLKSDLIDYVGSDIHNFKQINEMNKKVNIKSLDQLKKAINNNKIFS